MKQIVIVPITPIQELSRISPEISYLLSKLNLNTIIEIVLELDPSMDLSTALWDEVENKFTDKEFENLNLVHIDFLFESIIAAFYEELFRYTGTYDVDYRVHFWLNDSVCLVVKGEDDYIQSTLHYPASIF